MSRRAYHPPEAIARVRELAERPLPLDGFRAWADGPMPPEELAEKIDLIRWFLRRYPTPEARLRSARRRQLQLARTIAHATRHEPR